MRIIETIEKEDLKQLLVRCWMTHDAMWFANAMSEVGIDTTNKLNLGAIRSLAPIETRRILGVLGMEKVENIDQLRCFIDGAMELVGGDFMHFIWVWKTDDSLSVDVDQCFAHKGITKLGAIENYHCGIFVRIEAWFDALGVEYKIAPSDKHCLMHTTGRCHRDFRFQF